MFDRDSSPGHQKCAPCQTAADRQYEQQRGSSAQRGYGSAHRAERERQLAAFTPGQACARCGRPMNTADEVDLDHDASRTGWLGLSHSGCNRGASSKSRRTARQPAPALASAADNGQGDDDWFVFA